MAGAQDLVRTSDLAMVYDTSSGATVSLRIGHLMDWRVRSLRAVDTVLAHATYQNSVVINVSTTAIVLTLWASVIGSRLIFSRERLYTSGLIRVLPAGSETLRGGAPGVGLDMLSYGDLCLYCRYPGAWEMQWDSCEWNYVP